MWLDAVALALLAYFTIAGAMRGTLASFLRIFGLVAAYGLTWMLGPSLAPILGRALGMTDVAALVLAGTATFLLTLIAFNLVTFVLRRRRNRKAEHEPRTGLDRTLGGLFGAVHGGLLALLIGVLASWVEVGQKNGAFSELPRVTQPRVSSATRVVVEGAANAVLDENDRGARVAVRFAVRPETAISDVQALVADDALRSLQQDRLFWSYVENGAVDQALNQRSMLRITQDEELRRRLADLGLITDEALEDPTQMRREVRTMLEQLAPRIRILKNDPELERLAKDPEILAAIESGDTMTLVTDPRIRALVERILEG